MKKKFLTFFMTLALCLLALPLMACGETPNTGTVNIYVPDGATALALSYYMQDGNDTIGGKNVKITVVPSSNINTAVTGDSPADLAVIPSNLAAKLYNANGKYKLMMTLTHGNLYIIGNTATNVGELIGYRVGSIGRGQVPDLVLRYILKQNGIEYVESNTAVEGKVALSYYADGSAVAKAYKTGQIDFGLLAEPAATNISAAIESLSRLDVQQLWKDVTDMDGFPQACLVVKSEFAEKNADFVKAFAASLKTNAGYAETHTEETVSGIAAHMQEGSETTVKALTADIVKRCNVQAIAALDDRAAVEAYLKLFLDMETEMDTALIGGKLPDDSFYLSL